jgi:hypothetical protein
LEGVDDYLADLLISYKAQIALLRDQLEDMREQLARRDRQIDDLMRLMVGLQLEYKPFPPETASFTQEPQAQDTELVPQMERTRDGLYQRVELPQAEIVVPATPVAVQPEVASSPAEEGKKKMFSREELSRSIQRLRAKGKNYDEIARGLNQLNVATLSGQVQWTVLEVQNLLPALVSNPLGKVLGENHLD